VNQSERHVLARRARAASPPNSTVPHAPDGEQAEDNSDDGNAGD
jgi:hypothetical protein